MRNIISILLLLTALFPYAQRVSFEDPDLTFSFKKPKNWKVFDDGYVVKVSPSAKDTANIFFTITYFENAQPFGSFPAASPADRATEIGFTKTKINGVEGKRREEKKDELFINHYLFNKYGQRFELKTSTYDEQHRRIFRRIIKSIQIKN